ncbi:hypothetical protein ACJRO7_027116 [Eucalyptus globulus]|uniref:DNA-directed RNA polymerase RBP11-like dimerisation domain-containing protein n=1 Tax=Eucalyptus globulus TaxID=34317 RepID=A0ABD3JR30_EUCGL
MEHASFGDQRNATFSLDGGSYTCKCTEIYLDSRWLQHSYPSEALVNVRVQTIGVPAREVLKDACQDLMLMCQHVRGTFDKAVNDYCSSFRFIRSPTVTQPFRRMASIKIFTAEECCTDIF